MIYTIKVIHGNNEIRFGFNRFSDMTSFLSTVTETVDGFEAGETKIIISKEEETEDR